MSKNKNLKKHIVSFFFLVVLGIFAVGCSDTDIDTLKVQSQAPSYTLSAERLYREYDNNEISADEKYDGKVVLISGTVTSISKGIMGDASILFDGVHCLFTEGEQSSLARLSKGQQVTVKGKVYGVGLSNVLVRNCRLRLAEEKEMAEQQKRLEEDKENEEFRKKGEDLDKIFDGFPVFETDIRKSQR